MSRRKGARACGPAVALAIAAGLAGCVEPLCHEDADCDAPRICLASGACGHECTADAACGAGFRCEGHRCELASSGPIACPDDMAAFADAFCIDRFEASRPDATAGSAGSAPGAARSVAGVLPWQVGSNDEAASACAAAGKRLCTPQEWRAACRGEADTAYSYGDAYQPSTCNGIDAFGRSEFHLAPTGSFAGCENGSGAFDLNGNLWEHVAGGDSARVRGGAFNCGDSATLHRCDYVPRTWSPSALGFRCCRDGEPAP